MMSLGAIELRIAIVVVLHPLARRVQGASPWIRICPGPLGRILCMLEQMVPRARPKSILTSCYDAICCIYDTLTK